jgi:hypothetical protein
MSAEAAARRHISMVAISMVEIQPASMILTRNNWNTSYFRDEDIGISFIDAGSEDAGLITVKGKGLIERVDTAIFLDQSGDT